MKSINLITIEVTPDIAAKIRFMAESGLFSIQTGNASLNFHEGALKSIKTELMAYPKSYPHTATGSILEPSHVTISA